jgi:DNA mismatch repair protein MutS
MEKLTPMMAQYKKIKAEYDDCILMYRLGDFYEMFFEDAIEASQILHITLTARGKDKDQKIPMCGIPFHAVDSYLSKLTKAGKKIAICDQTTEPNGKGIVEREVVRVVTPGTTFDENIIDQKTNNYVVCIVAEKESFGFAYADVTTGDFKGTEIKNLKELSSEVARINPAECICAQELQSKLKPLFPHETVVFPHQYMKNPETQIKTFFDVTSLQSFGLEDKNSAVKAVGMLLNYLKETQKNDLLHLKKPLFYSISEFMLLDEALIRNLEIFYTNQGNKKHGSLAWVLDETVTPMGGRMLRNWLLHPLLEAKKINSRLEKVSVFVQNSTLLRDLRETLKSVFDIERLLSRLSLGTGNARDLNAMKQSLQAIPSLKNLIADKFEDINKKLEYPKDLVDLIDRAIKDEVPQIVREGGMIKEGYNQELDQLRYISSEGKTFLTNLQKKEVERTGISSLKVKFNKVFGYYIEISKTNLDSVPEDYIRKQTLVNAERFITPELKEYEEKILNAEERIKELEYELFYEVRMAVVSEILRIQNGARMIGALDTLSALAFVAQKNNYCKPEICEGDKLEIIGGRHPVIEQMSVNNEFVPNDCNFDEATRFLLITGPNMGGKSTYLRQVAINVLMAQIGSFVPAQKAIISPVDRIFTRVGASDNLSKGESTFMVEMIETAYILNNATKKSLIILDEIGRGTSTYDGVGIAWAVSEFIHNQIEAKTLFATHYHELMDFAETMEKSRNFSVAVKESEDGVVFLYKIVEGGVDKSYGIEVAKLAGLPLTVIDRARDVLNKLETEPIEKNIVSREQKPLFLPDESREHREIINELGTLDINNMTPLDALERLAKIKKKL